MKKYYNLEKKRKTGKIYYNAMNNKKRNNWDFYEKKMEENVMEKRSALITFQKRLWWRRSCNSSGKLNKYKTSDSRDFVSFNAFIQSCQLKTLKKLVNVPTVCQKTLVMF